MQGPSQLSREQQQALALAQAKRRRAEAEAQAQPAAPEQTPVGTGIAAMGTGMGYANPARIVPISPVQPGTQRGPAVPEGYKGNQFPTNWPKGMAAPPKAPEGYEWKDTGYSYDLKEAQRQDYVSMAPVQLRQMRADQEAAAQRSADQHETDAAFGGMDGLQMRDLGDGTVGPRPQRDLGVRATVNALNTMGPGTINAGLDMAEAAASASPGNAAMRAYTAAQNQQEQPRITFGGESAIQPQQEDMRFRVPEIPLDDPQNTAEQFADIGGDVAGYILGPGKGVEAGLKATGATNALLKIAPKGNSTAAKLGRYGARVANPIDDVAHAAAFGMATGEDGQRFETAAQYASDPINYLGRPIASLIQRGGIALSTLGKRVTPEAIQLEQALSVLQSGKATPAQMQAAAQVIDRYAPADDSIMQPAPAASQQPPPVQPQAAAQAVPSLTPPPVAQSPGRGAQAGAPGAGQQAPGGAQPVLNAVPTTPTISKAQAREAKDTAVILGRILRSGGIKNDAIRGYLPGLIQRYESLGDSRIPLARFVERDLAQHFPEGVVGDVVTKLRGFGRERHASTGPKDSSRYTVQDTVKSLRGSQQDHLTDVIRNNTYKKELIDAEDKIRADMRLNAEAGYETALANGIDRFAKGTVTADEAAAWDGLEKLMKAEPFVNRIPEHVKVQAMRSGKTLEQMIEEDPFRTAHWLQSALGKAERAAQGLGGKATPESLLYSELRGAVLDPLEKVVPGYKGARMAHGDLFGADEAMDFGEDLFLVAKSEVETARKARAFNKLSKAQQTVATMSIRDKLLNEFRGTPEDAAAKLTRLQQEGALDAIERILGADGKRITTAIRETVEENDWLRSIDQGSGSNTFSNLAGARDAAENVRGPVNKAVGSLGDKRTYLGAIVGDAVLSSVGVPPVLTVGKAASDVIGAAGRPSPRQLSNASKGLFGLPQPKATPEIRPPGNRLRGPRTVKTPEQLGVDLETLLKQYDEIDHRNNPTESARILKKIDAVRKRMAPAKVPAKAPPAPKDAGFAGVTPLSTLTGASGGALAGAAMDKENPGRGAVLGALGGAAVGYGAGRALTRSRPAGNALKSGPLKPPAAGPRRMEADIGRPKPDTDLGPTIMTDLPYSRQSPAVQDAIRRSSFLYRNGGYDDAYGFLRQGNDFRYYISRDPPLFGNGPGKYLVTEPVGYRRGDKIKTLGKFDTLDEVKDFLLAKFDPRMDELLEGRPNLGRELAGLGVTGMRGKTPDGELKAVQLPQPKPLAPIERQRIAGPKAPPASPTVKPSGAPKPPPVQKNAFPGSNAVVPAAAGAGGGAVGWYRAPDLNDDGYVSDEERMQSAVTLGVGGLTVAGVARTRGKNPNRSQLNTFGGVNAKTADRAALSKAQQMDAAGADRNAIWDQTGWFKGVDGKWRFEIDDAMFEARIPAQQAAKIDPPRTENLGVMFDDADAGGAYSDLSFIPTTIDRSMTGASHSSQTRWTPEHMRIGSRGQGSRSNALHERQHAIQDREDFARGGSPSTVNYTELVAVGDRMVDINRELGDLYVGKITASAERRIGALEDELAALQLRRNKLGDPVANEELYRRLAGETEARNVQTRRDFSPAERKAKRPWETQDVPDDQQIVRFGGGKAESRPKPPPAQAGFGGGKGPKAPPKVILEKRVAGRVGKIGPALSEKTRDAIRSNASLPPALRKSAYEASGNDPALIELAAPFMTGRAKDVRGKAGPAIPKPKNRLTSLDRGVHGARANAARAPDYPPLDSAAELRYRTENARRGAKSAVTRWENDNYDFNRAAAGKPQTKAPADKRQRLERQAETAALADRVLKQMRPTADDVEWLQRKATRRLKEIDDAIQRGQMSPDFASAKPRTQAEAKDMARMIFEAEYADLLDDVLSGRVVPKARSEHALAVFLDSSASIGAVGGAMALADINAAADRQRQTRDAAKAAKEEDMSIYREPTDPRFVWDWEKIKKTRRAAQTIQANLNALPPNKSDGRFNLTIDAWGPKTEAAVKRWQFENGFKPTGELTKEQWDLLDQQATEARQATR